MKVKDAMRRGTNCVDPDTPVVTIAKCMRDADVGAILVSANGRLVGIVTDRDIACRAVALDGKIDKLTAKDIMTKDVICCSPDDDLTMAIKAMEYKKVRRMPVTDVHKAMVGMLSLGDISHKMSIEQSGEVLRAVSAHHR
ncbi:inosine-5-monophosphate dehydrogenase [Bradyrhizobium sp. CCBAU 051011]|uniref:CBS domain-containing protein n=1 Tax=Bradyrhizobium sp. CCBAU 051011 TaxID=858422 RepID=UPI001374137D|nr:CBS domain-containing protein [Bradyrhizobium sp. CCBAU 051011]QHO75592.1 inosine-5-monophosphate dehydrogenase [Bradyrhizobium sp. CCBAU 051011]